MKKEIKDKIYLVLAAISFFILVGIFAAAMKIVFEHILSPALALTILMSGLVIWAYTELKENL